jgi:hypothetical protein
MDYRRFSKVLLALGFAGVSHAAMARPWTVGAQPCCTYTNAHPLMAPNTAPAYGYQAADVADNFTVATWLHTSPPGGQFDGPGVGSEAKARFDCNITFESRDDPIIFPGVQNGSPHDHSFFGNLAAAAAPYNATYASLRASGNSTCSGGPLNRSLYWEPSMKVKLKNNAVATVKPKNIITYYEAGSMSEIGTGTVDDPNVVTIWPRAWESVFGFNMNDPTDNRITAIIAAANASSPGRYSRVANGYGGFSGWTCSVPNTGAGAGGNYANSPVSGTYQPYLRNADLTAALDCAPNTDLIAEFASYPCWDGYNLSSPDGRGHMMPYLRDNNTGRLVCPDNWARVMTLRVKAAFNQKGAADYKERYFSSDRMAGTTQFLNGQSGHADFIPAWSYGTTASPGIFIRFVVNCGGVTVVMAGTTLTGAPHECGSGRIDSGAQVWGSEASPDGSLPNPLLVLSPDQTGPLLYFPLPTGTAVNGPVQHTH